MMIVPDADTLTVEARVNPQDIDQVKLGQIALLRLSAFNQRTTPEINGTVTRISADISTRSGSGANSYLVRIAMPPRRSPNSAMSGSCLACLSRPSCRRASGRLLSYLIKPLSDQLMRTFREK